MKSREPREFHSGLNRRTMLTSMLGAAAISTLPTAFTGLARAARPWNSINPRWYGFNLLEYFSTDPAWMKYFPYKNDGDFREDDFRWMRDWGFNWVRLPMDYRFWTDPNDSMKINDKALSQSIGDSARRKIWHPCEHLPAPRSRGMY